MTSELVVDVQPKEVSIALLEDKQLVELQSEGRNISFSVGNMYLGRVKKLMPGLNACFVVTRKTLFFIILTWVLNLTR